MFNNSSNINNGKKKEKKSRHGCIKSCTIRVGQGGLKAVVWTDTIQGLFSAAVTVFVLILGVNHVGGLSKVYEANARSDRWEFFK